MEKLYKQRIIKYYKTLAEEMIPEEIVQILITLTCIDQKQKQHLSLQLTKKGYYSHNKMLIKMLLEHPAHNLPLEKFVSALERSGQMKLAGMLKHDILAEGETVQIVGRIDCEGDTQHRRSELINKIRDSTHDLHKKFKNLYNPTRLTGDILSSHDTFQINITPKLVTKIPQIYDDVANGHLRKVVMQYAYFPHKLKWDVVLKVKTEVDTPKQKPKTDANTNQHIGANDEMSSKLVHLGNTTDDFLQYAAGTYQKSITSDDTGYESLTEFNKDLNSSTKIRARLPSGSITQQTIKEIPSPSIESMKKLIFAIIDEKNYTPFDFWKILQKCKSGSINPTDIKTIEGLNILHVCIDKGRLSFLNVIVNIGWWKILARERIPENSPHELSGKLAKQIAESKRAKKPLSEFNYHNEWENSLSSLMKACRSGDVSKVNQSLQVSGEDAFYCDYHGGNALYWAVINGNVYLIDALIENGLDPSARTKKNENLLHVAVSAGHAHLIGKLLKIPGSIDPFLNDLSHRAPIDRTAENGDVETLKQFVHNGIKPSANLTSLSAFMGRTPYLAYLLDNCGMSVNSSDMYSRTALHRACEGNKASIVKYLLQKGADLSLVTCTSKNLLHIIAENGSVELMSLILPILIHKKLLQGMISAQDKFNGVELCFLIRGRDKGRDAYHYVQVQRTLVPIFLIKTRSGNVDVAHYGEPLKSGWGVNPDQDVVDEIEDMFKQRKLDKSAVPDMTPLHVAIYKGHTQLAEMLLEKGSDVNIKDSFGNTPLMISASKGNLEIIRKIEAKGANFNEVNTSNKTAYDIAEENQHDDVMNYIKGRGFDHLISTFREAQMKSLEKKLKVPTLEQKRRDNVDVRRYIVDTLRDFSMEINQVLVDIGSSPVVEATDKDGPTDQSASINQRRKYQSFNGSLDSGIHGMSHSNLTSAYPTLEYDSMLRNPSFRQAHNH